MIIRNILIFPLKLYFYFASKRTIKGFNESLRKKRDSYEVKESINQYKTRTRKTSTKYSFPSINLLEEPKVEVGLENDNKRNAEVNKALLSSVLTDFKISGQITDVKQGPIVTLFELTPAPGTLTSSVTSKSEDIARSMSAISTRISTIPGKDALGIEIPNKRRETVYLRELLNSKLYNSNDFKLPLALGKDIFGAPVIVDLSKMPHLLVAGTTGSGKSVGINAMLLSLLYTLTPEECRLILIDPKMLELSVYQEIPHLLTEVVTDPKKAISALKWSVKEMEMRYQMMTHLGVREIDDYNKKVKKILDSGQVIFKETQVGYDSETGKPVMEKKALDLVVYPKIVVVVDELADLMLTSGKEIEGAIQRLSQMARASGIHLIVATQRPSVDVITGTIKSNFPTRISYKVVNKINSRTIIEEQGAEQLLGQGDLLITMLGERLKRVHGPFVKTEEVQAVVEHLKTQGEPEYLQSVTKDDDEAENFNLGLSETGDELYDKAVYIVCREKKASTSFIQRHLQIGYNRAARIIERMESEGVVSPANHVGRREVLVGKDN
jgi:S-DNA-T family DNA segregation ATPase FtsK/SpoIIIE